MEDALKSKAPGMKFGVDITEKPRPLPTVIHALGHFYKLSSRNHASNSISLRI